MSEDFKPGTRALLRLAGLDADRAFISREDENLALWRSVVVLLMRLHIDPDPESRRNSGAADAQVVHALRAALAENFGIEAGSHIAWALIHYGCRQKPTMASLHIWERLMFEWQQRRASAPRIALMLRDAGLPEPLGPRALDSVDRWIGVPPSALGAAPEIIASLFPRRLVTFNLKEAGGGEAALVQLFGELVASAVPPGTLVSPRLRSVSDGAGTRWIVDYGFHGVECSYEAPAEGTEMRLDGMMSAVDGLLAQIHRAERVFQLVPGRVGPDEPLLFVVADGVRFGEVVRRLRVPTLRVPREADGVSAPIAPVPGVGEGRSAAPSPGDTIPASLLGGGDTAPASLLPLPTDTVPASLMGTTIGAALDTPAEFEVTIELPLDDPATQAPESMLPLGEQPSGLESQFVPTPPDAIEADAAMRSIMVSLRRSFGAGRLLQSGKWVRLAHVSPPVKIQTNPSDPMRVLYAKQEMLLRKGRIVWAAVVPLDKSLNVPGKEDLPALCVYSPDDYFDARPAALAGMAARLAALRTAPAVMPELRRIGQQVRNDSGRPLDFPLPPQMTSRPVMLTSFMAVRSHLPDTVLIADWFPVLIHPDSVIPLVVPSAFWSSGLRAAWDARQLTTRVNTTRAEARP
jgi:hypothetical protein